MLHYSFLLLHLCIDIRASFEESSGEKTIETAGNRFVLVVAERAQCKEEQKAMVDVKVIVRSTEAKCNVVAKMTVALRPETTKKHGLTLYDYEEWSSQMEMIVDVVVLVVALRSEMMKR